MIYFIDLYSGYPVEIPSVTIWIGLAIVLSVFISLYVLRAIGVHTLAKNKGVKNAFLAWFPFCWTFIMAKTVEDKVKFFGRRFKGFAWWILLAYTLTEVLYLASNVLTILPLAKYYFSGLDGSAIIYFASPEDIVQHVGSAVEKYSYIDFIYTAIKLPDYIPQIERALLVISLVHNTVSVAYVVFEVFLYVAVFRTYWPKLSWLAILLSVFAGLFPIFVFIVRKNKEFNMEEYIRAQTGNYYTYGGGNPYGHYGNPYSRGGNTESKTTKPNDDPFSEFGGDGKDYKEPFDEFNGDDR